MIWTGKGKKKEEQKGERGGGARGAKWGGNRETK